MGNETSQFGKKIENDVSINWEKDVVQCPFAPREGQATAVIGSKLYLFGGVVLTSDKEENADAESNELLTYDIELKKWSNEDCSGTLPSQRSGATMSPMKKSLYLFGGLSQLSGWMNDLYVFDTESKSWRQINSPNAPSPRDKVMSASSADKLYIFGGFGPMLDTDSDVDEILTEDDDDGEYEDMDELQDVRNCQEAANFTWSNQLYMFDANTEQWTLVKPSNDNIPSPRAAHSLSLMQDKHEKEYLFVFGGRDIESRQNDLWRFSVAENSWEECKGLGCQPQARSFHGVTPCGHRLIIFGGRSVNNQHLNDLHIFDTLTKEWLQPNVSTSKDGSGDSAVIPPTMGLHSLCVVGKYLILFGGSCDLDPATGTCTKFFNDVYRISISQLLKGDAIKDQKESTDTEVVKNSSVPGLLDLKPQVTENSLNNSEKK